MTVNNSCKFRGGNLKHSKTSMGHSRNGVGPQNVK